MQSSRSAAQSLGRQPGAGAWPRAEPGAWVELGDGVLAGFTQRAGGFSRGAWSSLNLGLHVGDDAEAVAANRAAVSGWAGAPVAFGRQVHGTRVTVVDSTALARDLAREDLEGQGLGGQDLAGEEPGAGCDALVTVHAGVSLGVLVADCVPVLLADPQARVVAAAHAGRRGLLDGVLQQAVAAMVARGARPASVRAVLGPAAGACCYEVPAAMRAAAGDVLSSLPSSTRRGTPSLDLRAGCRQALGQVGVGSVRLFGGCTIEDDAVFSHRRVATTGRFAGVVRLLS